MESKCVSSWKLDVISGSLVGFRERKVLEKILRRSGSLITGRRGRVGLMFKEGLGRRWET